MRAPRPLIIRLPDETRTRFAEKRPSASYPEGKLGGNQLLDGAISLSQLYLVPTIGLHVRIATDLHQGFP